MNLRYIVPALGILISTSGALFAENVGGLTVGGFVDTTGTIQNVNDDPAASSEAVNKFFAAAVELRLGYKVGDKVTAQVDMEWNNDNTDTNTNVEQAYVNWALTNTVSLTTGKFTSYAGWESADADGLYRVNHSPIFNALYTDDVIGVAVNFQPMADLGVSVFVLNGLFGEAFNDSTNSLQALAVDAVYKVKDVGTFNAEFGFDAPAPDQTAYSLGLNATIKLASYQPLTVGAEFMLNGFKDDAANTDGKALGFMVMGNHTLPSSKIMPFPSSVTGMISLLSAEGGSGVDLGAGTSATRDSNSSEIAVALLTNPTNDSHFGVNAELAYQVVSQDNLKDDITSILFALEAIAVIP